MAIANINNIEIWHEVFGNPQHPAVLLIMGGCCQGIMWPTEFCELLTSAGYFVIRYDHRDTGQSSWFDFTKNPYSLSDMAQDALQLLDYLQIKQAHLAGLSLGGAIAQFLAVHASTRVHSISLIATSSEFRPMNLAYAGLPMEAKSLSRTKDIYLNWMKEFKEVSLKNTTEQLQFRVAGWKILSGDKVPFEEKRYQQLHAEFIARARHPTSHLNHIQICHDAEALIRELPKQINIPTVVIHGTEDPLFPPDHGTALASKIKQAKVVLVDGMGHVPNCAFYDLIVRNIQNLAATFSTCVNENV